MRAYVRALVRAFVSREREREEKAEAANEYAVGREFKADVVLCSSFSSPLSSPILRSSSLTSLILRSLGGGSHQPSRPRDKKR